MRISKGKHLSSDRHGDAAARADESSARDEFRVLRISHASLTPALRVRERALVEHHADVRLEVVCAASWHEGGIETAAQTDELYRVTPARTHLVRSVPLFAYDPRPIISTLRRHRPHLIDLHQESYSVACAETLALCDLFAPRAPVVLAATQNILRRYPPPFAQLERRAFARVAAAYPCSESVLEVLRAKGFDKPAPVIGFGVDLDAFEMRAGDARAGEPPVIGFIGRMLPAKGLDVLAEALRLIDDLPWRALFVGDGDEREITERRLRESGLLERARFTGAVPHEEVARYYREMDVLAMPTRTTNRVREQFGRVLVEAMASGVAVVGSTSGAIPEVIGDAGIVVAENDPASLADALRRMLCDENTRRELARRGRARVERLYTWRLVADQMYQLYRQTLDAHEACRVARSDAHLHARRANAELEVS